MIVKTEIVGDKNLEKQLVRLAKKANLKHDYIVGYTQSYAIYVHENLTARHKVGKSAKYLEIPAKRIRSELLTIIKRVYRNTNDLLAGIKMAALRLQRESQKIVPVDTGALKNSAFTRKVRR